MIYPDVEWLDSDIGSVNCCGGTLLVTSDPDPTDSEENTCGECGSIYTIIPSRIEFVEDHRGENPSE